MNIAYHGYFLREGLELAGHNIVDVSKNGRKDITEEIESLPCSIDFILLELWDHKSLPLNLHACRHRLVAYCIDTPINEYWLVELCKLFDDVFVDQKSTVARFKRQGITSVWLPLCAQQAYFRTPTEKTFDITFVGNTSNLRTKRNNLLTLLGRHFSINICQNISMARMLDIFTASRIVLNENLFSGLTLRIFQGLATGSLVLTEDDGCGVDEFFKHGRQLLCYTPHSIVKIIEDILSDYTRYEDIARAGQEACRLHHTSRVRAEEFLASIEGQSARNPRVDPDLRKLHETKARYRLKMRFGGSLREVASDFAALAGANSRPASEAACELADIAARSGNTERARMLYARALHSGFSIFPELKIAMLHIHRGEIEEARRAISRALRHMPKNLLIRNKNIFPRLSTASEPSELLFIVARIYFLLGRVFFVGFLKQFDDKYLDSALEIAHMAWKIRPLPEYLDFMIQCASMFGVQGELLQECISGIENGYLTDRQILYTARLAESYYNFDLAKSLVKSFRKTL